MESEAAVMSKDMKVEIPGMMSGGLARQGSMTKHNCLCSPTTHVGSFRCRMHRTPTLQRTKSIDTKVETTVDSVLKHNDL